MNLQEWNQTYLEHSAWESIENTLELVKSYKGGDETQQDMLDHIRLALTAVLEMRNAPTLLVSPQMLQALEQSVTTNIHAQLTSWINSANAAYLSNAYTNLHTALEVVRGWPSSKSDTLRSAAAVLREAIKATDAHVDSMARSVEATKASLDQQLTSVQAQMDQRDEEASTRFQELEAKIAETDANLTEIDERLDRLVNEQQARFDQAEQDRITKHQGLLESQRASLQKELQSTREQTEQALEAQETSAQVVLDQLESLKEKAASVVSVVATSTTSEWYKRHADEQKSTANQMRWIAYGTFIFASVLTLAWVVWLDHRPDSILMTVLKIGISGSLLAASGYFITESSKHRDEEFRARSTEIRLRALDPFIAPLEEGKRQEILQATAQNLFVTDGMTAAHTPQDRPIERAENI